VHLRTFLSSRCTYCRCKKAVLTLEHEAAVRAAAGGLACCCYAARRRLSFHTDKCKDVSETKWIHASSVLYGAYRDPSCFLFSIYTLFQQLCSFHFFFSLFGDSLFTLYPIEFFCFVVFLDVQFKSVSHSPSWCLGTQVDVFYCRC